MICLVPQWLHNSEITPTRVIAYRLVPCHTMPCHSITLRSIASCHVIWCDVMWYYTACTIPTWYELIARCCIEWCTRARSTVSMSSYCMSVCTVEHNVCICIYIYIYWFHTLSSYIPYQYGTLYHIWISVCCVTVYDMSCYTTRYCVIVDCSVMSHDAM